MDKQFLPIIELYNEYIKKLSIFLNGLSNHNPFLIISYLKCMNYFGRFNEFCDPYEINIPAIDFNQAYGLSKLLEGGICRYNSQFIADVLTSGGYHAYISSKDGKRYLFLEKDGKIYAYSEEDNLFLGTYVDLENMTFNVLKDGVTFDISTFARYNHLDEEEIKNLIGKIYRSKTVNHEVQTIEITEEVKTKIDQFFDENRSLNQKIYDLYWQYMTQDLKPKKYFK